MLTDRYHTLTAITKPHVQQRSERHAALVKTCRRLAYLASLEANDTAERDARARITRLVLGCDEEIRRLLAVKE